MIPNIISDRRQRENGGSYFGVSWKKINNEEDIRVSARPESAGRI